MPWQGTTSWRVSVSAAHSIGTVAFSTDYTFTGNAFGVSKERTN